MLHARRNVQNFGGYLVQGLIKEQDLLLYLTKLGGDQSSRLYKFQRPIILWDACPHTKSLKIIINKRSHAFAHSHVQVTCKALRVWPCFNSGFSTFPKPGVLKSERVVEGGTVAQNVVQLIFKSLDKLESVWLEMFLFSYHITSW